MIREEALGTTSTYKSQYTAKTYGSLAIDDGELDGDLQTLPVHGGLLDIVTNLLGGLLDYSTTQKQLPFRGDRP